MNCQSCGSEAVAVHLTQIVDKEMRTLHLCERCAAEKGLQATAVPENFPLTDFLAQMEGEPRSAEAVAPSPDCSYCGLAFSEFKDAGRLGCPHCWSSFEVQLRGLVRRIHSGSQHVGQVYLSPAPATFEREKRLGVLRRKLERAVELEDFERAAELRDQIRATEPVALRGGAV